MDLQKIITAIQIGMKYLDWVADPPTHICQPGVTDCDRHCSAFAADMENLRYMEEAIKEVQKEANREEQRND